MAAATINLFWLSGPALQQRANERLAQFLISHPGYCGGDGQSHEKGRCLRPSRWRCMELDHTSDDAQSGGLV